MFRCSYLIVFLLLRLSNYECVKSRPFPGFHIDPDFDGLPEVRQGPPSSGASHGYPAGKELSGNSHTGAGQTTNVHYHYNPPQSILYTSTRGGPPVKFPVYHGSPPTYVYQYKESGSKYGTLLAGLALLNLGSLTVSAYALSKNHSNYTPKPGEVCKFAITKDEEVFEKTIIDCNLISSFIYQEEATTPGGAGTDTSTMTTVTNVTMTVPYALDVKGEPIDVTPEMYCVVLSHIPSRNILKSVPCGLLQSYADQSLKKNSASRNLPVIPIFIMVFAILIAY